MRSLIERCTDVLNSLRESPVFAMSRGAKELFHTNFLAFVLEIDSDSLSNVDRPCVMDVQARLRCLLFETRAPAKVIAWRECQSLDLVLVGAPTIRNGVPVLGDIALNRKLLQKTDRAPDAGGQSTEIIAVVIEAKLKALPDAEQLRRYNSKLVSGIRLAFLESVKPEADEFPLTLDPITWGEIAVSLRDEQRDDAFVWAYPALTTEQESDGHTSNDLELSTEKGSVTSRTRVAGQQGRLRRVLLAPADFTDVAGKAGWTLVSWTDLVDCFSSVEYKAEVVGGVSSLLKDYAQSTRALARLLAHVGEEVTGGFRDSPDATLGRLYSAVSHQAFTNMRLHDITGKYSYSVLVHEIASRIAGDSDCADVAFHSEVFMTRGTPGFNFEYRLSKTSGPDKTGTKVATFRIGVQVQGAIYRHFISATSVAAESVPTLESIAELLNGRKWWNLSDPEGRQTLRFFGKDVFAYVARDGGALTFDALRDCIDKSLAAARDLVARPDVREKIEAKLANAVK